MSQNTIRGVINLPSSCAEGILDSNNRPSLCLVAGLIVGAAGMIIGGWIGFLSTGHQLNDPIYLALSINSVIMGFLYFNWSGFLTPLAYAAALGVAAGFTVKLLAIRASRRLLAQESGNAASIAAVISALPVWIQEVSGFQVLIMYALATWLSMIIAKSFAKRIVHK